MQSQCVTGIKQILRVIAIKMFFHTEKCGKRWKKQGRSREEKMKDKGREKMRKKREYERENEER